VRNKLKKFNEDHPGVLLTAAGATTAVLAFAGLIVLGRKEAGQIDTEEWIENGQRFVKMTWKGTGDTLLSTTNLD